jgi:hypothetical protein
VGGGSAVVNPGFLIKAVRRKPLIGTRRFFRSPTEHKLKVIGTDEHGNAHVEAGDDASIRYRLTPVERGKNRLRVVEVVRFKQRRGRDDL